MINTGMFNKRVTFFKSNRKINEYGARGERTREGVFSCFGYVSNIRGSEFWESNRITNKAKLRLRIRFHPKMKEVNTFDTFVEIDNKDYNILSIENVYNRNREFYMYLESVKDEVGY